MIEVKEMSWSDFKQAQAEFTDDNVFNSELLVKYSTGLTLEEINNLPRSEVSDLIARANKANGFTAKDAEKNSEEIPSESEPCTLPTD